MSNPSKSVVARNLLTPLARIVLAVGLAGAAGVVGGLGGCESSQNAGGGASGGTPANTGGPGGGAQTSTASGGITIVHNDWREVGYRWDWTGFPVTSQGEDIKYVNTYDDALVVQGMQNSLTVMDAVTGRNRWSDRPANPLAQFVGAYREGDTLFNCSESEVFIMDINTGNWKDRQSMSEVVNTRPLRSGNTLIFGTTLGQLFSHRTDFGVTAWGNDLGGPIEADPIFVNGTVGAVTQDGVVAFLMPGSGSSVSRSSVGGPMRTNPVTDGSTMFVACMDQSVYAFRPGQQRHVWRYRTNEPLEIQPTYADGVVYVTVPGTGLVALDAIRGSENWIGSDAGGVVVAQREGTLIVQDGTTVKAVEPKNGDVLYSFQVPGLSKLIADQFEDGHLYATTKTNAVIRFATR